MAIRPLNSTAGFSTGDPAVVVIQANADVTTINLTANGISNLGNVGNVKITGGLADQYLKTDGLGNLTWSAVANASSNRAAVMPYLIPTGESYIVNENFQGLYSQAITIDGELEVDGILIEVPISFDAEPNQVLFALNGNPTGRPGFTIDAVSGNLALPGKVTVTGNVLPSANDTYDLGSSTYKWRNGYFGGNTLYLDTATISVDANGFVVITNETGGQFVVAGSSTSNSTSIVNGTSNIVVNASANITFGVAGTSNVLVLTTAGGNLTGNLTTGGVKTDNLYYANGNPWNFGQDPGGSNTYVQFNDSDSFGGSANFVFNKSTNNLTVTGNFITNTGAIYGNGSGLTQLTGANVTGTVASATVAGTVTTAAQPNITSVGTLTSVAVTGNVTAGNVYANTGTIGASLLTGTLSTAAQPNITSVGILSSLDVTGNVTAGGVKTNNLYYANGSPWDLQQPAGSSTQVQFNNNNDFGASANFTFNSSTNVLELLGTLKATNLDISGNGVIGGNLTVNGNLVYVNVEEFSVEDPIVNLNTGPNGVPPVANSGKDVGTALNYYDTQAQIAFMGWDTSNAEFAFSSQSSITGEIVTFTTLGNLRAQTFKGNIEATTIAGNLTTATQSNITTVGTLGSLAVTANITAGNVTSANIISANYLISTSGCVTIGAGTIAVGAGTGGIFNSSVNDINLGLAANVTIGSATGNTTIQGNLVANNNITVTGNISANLITGTLTTASQANITTVGTLTNLTVAGNANSNSATSNTVTTNSIISKRSNIAVTTDTVIDSFDATKYRTAKYVIKSENDDGYESLEVLLIHNNINSYITVYAAINDGGGNTITISSGISSGNVELRATGLATNTVVNLIGTYVPD